MPLPDEVGSLSPGQSSRRVVDMNDQPPYIDEEDTILGYASGIVDSIRLIRDAVTSGKRRDIHHAIFILRIRLRLLHEYALKLDKEMDEIEEKQPWQEKKRRPW